ncbi:cytochrome c-type biogenesis protein CcmH [Duganella ginsengisoli]|uniref:Cytochrome c-type biogenesis protein n=2 Tax=Pseudoduganella ginsengisoli TaxID=1462440 RepID=A0A6L6PWL5_9BURK|nr:cytochrome c-type biogenesis protein [Pseudoduganella ginsengisoli]MTW01551.1 cytochrome c-type biogenesis protein CcmH [Pseudoduganella ginsengisoli]
MQRRYLRASRTRKGLALLGLTALLALACAAVSAAPSGGALESRVERLSSELRCLVCDNQTIADSNAQLARDLKGVVREQLAAGRSEDDVVAFLTQRYGDFVLYKPPVRASTWPLWFGPFVLLGGGLWWLWRTLQRQQGGSA